MPNYPWLLTQDTDVAALPGKIHVQRMLGVPFESLSAQEIFDRVTEQSKVIAKDLRVAGAYVAPEKEIIALTAYLQSLGKSKLVAPQTALLQ
jgi:cytochrome c oxidase cbb3-type subunit I/II